MMSADDVRAPAIAEPQFARAALAALKNKLSLRFLEFTRSASETTTLRMAASLHEGAETASLLLSWHTPGGSSHAAHGQVEPPGSPRLFELRHDAEPAARPAKAAALPFADAEFDWVFCDTVIEHVGALERQYLLLAELNRIARRGIFVTTVNRWHPLEFYTGLPLTHWLPGKWPRRMLIWLGKPQSAAGARPNLIGSRELEKLANLLPSRPDFSIGHIRYGGIKAAFFLQIRKPPYD